MLYLSVSLLFQNFVDLLLEEGMIKLVLSLLEQFINLKGLFGDLAVLVQKLIIGNDLVLLMLSKETAICANKTLVLQTYQICLLRVEQASIEAQPYPLR